MKETENQTNIHQNPAEKKLEEDKFQLVPNILINHVRYKKLITTDIVVYCIFLDHQRRNKDSWISNSTVAMLLGMSEKTVERSIKSLAKAGHLKRYGKTKYGTRRTMLTTRVVGTEVKENIKSVAFDNEMQNLANCNLKPKKSDETTVKNPAWERINLENLESRSFNESSNGERLSSNEVWSNNENESESDAGENDVPF